MTLTAPYDWTTANQRSMVAELALLKARLGEGDEAAATAELELARADMREPAAIDRLVEIFDLSTFERDVLLLAAGVELDARLAELCGEAVGRPERPWATFGLALSVLPEPVWGDLAPVRALRRWRLILVDENAGLASARIRIDERILHYLAGLAYLDPHLEPLFIRAGDRALMVEDHEAVAVAVGAALETIGPPLPLIQLHGDDESGQEEVAGRAAGRLGLDLFILRAEDVPADPHECAALASLWEREAALTGCALLIHRGGEAHPAGQRFAERVEGLVFVAGDRPLDVRRADLRYAVRRPGPGARKRLWEAALGPVAARLDGELDGVAGQFCFSARTVAKVAAEVVERAESGAEPALWRACRSIAPTRLETLAQRIEPAAQWDDLVLPEPQLESLRRIAAFVRYRLEVHDTWGFARKGARGLGLSSLFTGESGTGKTMAAEVLAGELELDLFRVDLSSVVSKYIGETEKNLRQVFDAAEESGSVLLFDEADALFGKRSEVKDSHDRYANIEVSYLLQRMEVYRGLAILTTNLKTALDQAFQRRLRFIVQFPFPDQNQREAIWRGIFPAETPVNGLDYPSLARLNVPGGSIRNIALNAAFLAAADGGQVGMGHLLLAARSEASKRERPMSDAEVRGWQ